MHTIFSDGNVWPTVRIDEATHSLDTLAITDHLAYTPKRILFLSTSVQPGKSGKVKTLM